MPGTIRSKLFQLFDNRTIGEISMFLIFQKELTAAQLARLIGKNISTITRNLEKLLEANLIYISKVESKGNLQVKFWALNEEIKNMDYMVRPESILDLPEEKQLKTIQQMQNMLISFRSILKTIYDYHVKNLVKNLQEKRQEEDSNIFLISLFNEETGRIFEEELYKFLADFVETHEKIEVNLDSIDSDSIIAFLITSRLGDAITLPNSSQSPRPPSPPNPPTPPSP
ncbi:MAG: winged helix-turn-helix domain-containing protein [Candidatus Hodarchaeota archaeon]